MKILNLVQGSPEWLAARAKYNTASEASMMMGEHPSASRSELLHIKATGDEQEFSKFTLEVIFPRGHEVEAAARPIAEEIIGDELYAVTGACEETGLLASFDGLTMDETIAWECKQWNEAKAEQVRAGIVPACDYWQVVQQLVVSRAEKLIYMVTDGSPENTVYLEISGDADDEATLLAHWEQFNQDKANYQVVEAEPVVVGRSPEDLPALRVEVQGMVTASNLDAFKEHALAVFADINRDLSTDTDFANAEKTVKWCKEVEGKLDGAKAQALEQTASIDQLFKTIDAVKDEARAVRLELDKLVKARKAEIRGKILADAQAELDAHLVEVSVPFETHLAGAFKLPEIPVDFAGAMKNKRTITSLRDAAATELARAKVEANTWAAHIMANTALLAVSIEGYVSLFPDAPALVLKEADDMQAIAKLRIAEHVQAEEERKRQEEANKREEEAKAAQESQAQESDPGVGEIPPELTRKSAAAPQGQRPARPTYGDLVRLVAREYQVSADIAATWIHDLTTEHAT